MKKSYRTAGWMAVASGLAGLAGVSFLIAYLVIRPTDNTQGMLMGKLHDVSVIIQMMFLAFVVNALYKISLTHMSRISRSMLLTGIGALLFTALFLLLGLTKIIADVLYMFPQGIFGVWLLVFCVRNKGLLSRGMKWFGIVVGFGLALVGIFPLEYALFVDSIILHVPAVPPEVIERIPVSDANMIVHQLLFIGSPLGVLTLPFWTLLLGRRLFMLKVD